MTCVAIAILTTFLLLSATVSSASALSAAASALASVHPIGTGLSQAKIGPTEAVLFEHVLSAGSSHGVLNHLWAAGSPEVDDAIIRYYVDNETTASLEFSPNEMAGVGFGDQTAPWANKWMGKGAAHTGWFNNFQVPFGASVRVTFQSAGAGGGTIWLIVRGAENLPMRVGVLDLPSTARLHLTKKSAELAPLDFFDIAEVPAGNGGLLFMSSLVINSTLNLNFMEGCFHYYSPPAAQWPGMLLSTGMEDYYDSAFYFDGGPFHAPVSGVTHLDAAAAAFSGYRFHEMDPIVFSDGMRFQWRNGDVTDQTTGLKCTAEASSGPNIKTCGSPQRSIVSSYAWIYLW